MTTRHLRIDEDEEADTDVYWPGFVFGIGTSGGSFGSFCFSSFFGLSLVFSGGFFFFAASSLSDLPCAMAAGAPSDNAIPKTAITTALSNLFMIGVREFAAFAELLGIEPRCAIMLRTIDGQPD